MLECGNTLKRQLKVQTMNKSSVITRVAEICKKVGDVLKSLTEKEEQSKDVFRGKLLSKHKIE